MSVNGFIKLHRKMTEWGWYTDASTKVVFLHLLLTANYQETEWKGIKIKPGQVVVGRKKLAQDLGLSERQVRTALEHLKSTNEVTIEVTNQFSIVTIENWAKYQLINNDNDQQNDQQRDQQPTNKRPATDQQPTTSKERKESKKDKKVKNINNPPIIPPEGKRFVPPTVEEVRDFCLERNNGIDAEAFVDFYQSKGWYVGKNKMKDWKAAVRTWERSRRKQESDRKADFMDL